MDTETTIGGRPARIEQLGRVRQSYGKVISLVRVRFLDTNETHTMPGGKFAKWATKADRTGNTQVTN